MAESTMLPWLIHVQANLCDLEGSPKSYSKGVLDKPKCVCLGQ